MLNLTISQRDVQSVYSGRPGCCCGCRGKHTYASATYKDAAKQRGYPIDANEVNDATVKLILNRMMSMAANREDAAVSVTPRYVSVEIVNRLYIAYFVPQLFNACKARKVRHGKKTA
jgi:hypothetical protein